MTVQLKNQLENVFYALMILGSLLGVGYTASVFVFNAQAAAEREKHFEEQAALQYGEILRRMDLADARFDHLEALVKRGR